MFNPKKTELATLQQLAELKLLQQKNYNFGYYQNRRMTYPVLTILCAILPVVILFFENPESEIKKFLQQEEKIFQRPFSAENLLETKHLTNAIIEIFKIAIPENVLIQFIMWIIDNIAPTGILQGKISKNITLALTINPQDTILTQEETEKYIEILKEGCREQLSQKFFSLNFIFPFLFIYIVLFLENFFDETTDNSIKVLYSSMMLCLPIILRYAIFDCFFDNKLEIKTQKISPVTVLVEPAQLHFIEQRSDELQYFKLLISKQEVEYKLVKKTLHLPRSVFIKYLVEGLSEFDSQLVLAYDSKQVYIQKECAINDKQIKKIRENLEEKLRLYAQDSHSIDQYLNKWRKFIPYLKGKWQVVRNYSINNFEIKGWLFPMDKTVETNFLQNLKSLYNQSFEYQLETRCIIFKKPLKEITAAQINKIITQLQENLEITKSSSVLSEQPKLLSFWKQYNEEDTSTEILIVNSDNASFSTSLASKSKRYFTNFFKHNTHPICISLNIIEWQKNETIYTYHPKRKDTNVYCVFDSDNEAHFVLFDLDKSHFGGDERIVKACKNALFNGISNQHNCIQNISNEIFRFRLGPYDNRCITRPFLEFKDQARKRYCLHKVIPCNHQTELQITAQSTITPYESATSNLS